MLVYNLKTLKLFLSVYQERSISKAASREAIAVSALSKRIAELEYVAGTPLFQRLSSGVRPTDAGDSLARHVENLMFTLSQIRAELSDHAKGVRGEVHVLASSSALLSGLVQEIHSYAQKHPSIIIDVQEARASTLIRAVTEGKADVGVFPANADAGHLQVFPYQTIRVMLVTPRDHPLAKRQKVRFSETLQYEYVGLQDGTAFSSIFLSSAMVENPRFKLRMKAISYESLRKMVEVGVGISIMPESSCVPYIGLQNIACIPLSDDWGNLDIRICVRSFDALPIAARSLIQHLSGHLSGSKLRNLVSKQHT